MATFHEATGQSVTRRHGIEGLASQFGCGRPGSFGWLYQPIGSGVIYESSSALESRARHVELALLAPGLL
jgi:hypothetical protein